MSEGLSSRIEKPRLVFTNWSLLLHRRDIRLSLKGRVNAASEVVLLYGSETSIESERYAEAVGV